MEERVNKLIRERFNNMKKHELKHHGIKGQKWGVRRYQNKDGTLTKLGKKKTK